MNAPMQTSEFSICLLPDYELDSRVQELRRQLPPSPYRDDTPHITLLRGISSTVMVDDSRLLDDVDSAANFSESLPVGVEVDGIENKSNQFYASTGLVLLKPSAKLLGLRARVISELTTSGYIIEPAEIERYMPHLTVRLGVPLTGESLEAARILFPEGSTITFGRWVLFRLIKQGEARLMREIKKP